MNKHSETFMGNMQTIHRTGAVTDDTELHAAYERIVRRALVRRGAEDLLPVLFEEAGRS